MPLRVEPDHVYFPIKAGNNVDPDNVTSPGTKPAVQKSIEATHLRPVAAVHSDVPQVQSTEFASLPSVVVQTVVGKRRFDTGIELDPSTEPCFGTLSTELVYIEACSKLTPIAYGSKGGSECIACATGNLDEPRWFKKGFVLS